MSLWTPSGEHRVERERASGGTNEPPPVDTDAGDISYEDLTPEQQAQVDQMTREMEETRERMLQLPSGAVIGQQALPFYELAALYLSQDPPRLADAQAAIDALTAVVERLGERLGDAEAPLRQAVNQLQVAYVETAKKNPES